ncbi:MAG: DUF4091 domain-containing protein [bacterium]|nr:DUF4091 domain-containing protein [bacterium]
MYRRITLVAILVAGLALSAVAAVKEPCILFDDSYGERLPGTTDGVALWWASPMHKVSKDRVVPKAKGKALDIRAARNEAEPAQLVVTPKRALTGFVAEGCALTGPDGATIPAENVTVLRVRYVHVDQVTDRWGAVADWPDPLPPFKNPIDLEAGKNQPVWVLVKVPATAPAGVYKGHVLLKADGYRVEAPVRVVVYDFDMPERMTLTTAFGFSAGNIFSYQKLKEPEQRKEVMRKYLEDYSAHHISPYDPTIFSNFEVEWVKLTADEAKNYPEADRKLLQESAITPRFDWTAWDAEMEQAIEGYKFNSFRLGLPGIAGSMCGFEVGSRGHELAFTAYCQAAQEHLREKGWLDEAYVYWTDEPNKNQYEWVQNGFLRLKKAAPDINRMITEHVVDELIDGPNIWCPDSWWYEHDRAVERTKEGDVIWWYICTVPKKPFPGLFTDHPGTDLRAWLWQTWKYDIEGILVWATNLWTTGAAYPDKPQNPYEDTMSWVHGYGTKKGEKKPWGNGDGRFVYPPEIAADANPPGPVLDGPVSSIRWEILRDGIEDYEYFTILERLLDEQRDSLSKRKARKYERLLEIPDEITSDLKTFSKDPKIYEKRRDEVARAIETLSGK